MSRDSTRYHQPSFDDDTVSIQQPITQERRHVLTSILLGAASSFSLVGSANAGEVGAKITKAVTQSDLGISVRTSVVRGAQVMDQIDGKWEQFSDRFGLGSERSKQPGRPKPKVIPDPLPLDAPTANEILKLSDEVFLSLFNSMTSTRTTLDQLDRQLTKIAEVVRPSFQRSIQEKKGDSFVIGDNVRDVTTAEQFNFAAYVHFKAYSDLILQQAKGFDFNTFRRNFEVHTGQRLVTLLMHQSTPPKAAKKTEELLKEKLNDVDQLCTVMKQKGLLSLAERSPLESDQIDDWLDDMSDLTFTIALDGDITLGSQMLLQEQGFRLYPDFGRFAVSSLLQGIDGQQVTIDDYYFDTDYNSDPDKFDVKEVVLNVVLDSV